KDRHSRTNVGGFDLSASQARRPDDHGAVRVAEDDARTHADEFVHEEHARLEHLLVHHDDALALRCGHDGNRHHICRECGPRLVFELGNVAAKITLNPLLLLGGDDEIGLVRSALDAAPCKSYPIGLEVIDVGVSNTTIGAGDLRGVYTGTT